MKACNSHETARVSKRPPRPKQLITVQDNANQFKSMQIIGLFKRIQEEIEKHHQHSRLKKKHQVQRHANETCCPAEVQPLVELHLNIIQKYPKSFCPTLSMSRSVHPPESKIVLERARFVTRATLLRAGWPTRKD